MVSNSSSAPSDLAAAVWDLAGVGRHLMGERVLRCLSLSFENRANEHVVQPSLATVKPVACCCYPPYDEQRLQWTCNEQNLLPPSPTLAALAAAPDPHPHLSNTPHAHSATTLSARSPADRRVNATSRQRCVAGPLAAVNAVLRAHPNASTNFVARLECGQESFSGDTAVGSRLRSHSEPRVSC